MDGNILYNINNGRKNGICPKCNEFGEQCVLDNLWLIYNHKVYSCYIGEIITEEVIENDFEIKFTL